MLLVKVKSLSVTDMGFILFLKHKHDKRLFPIFIGAMESKAISSVLMNTPSKRPLTHDLLKKILNLFKFRVQRVVIDHIVDGTLRSKIYLEQKSLLTKLNTQHPNKVIEVDARPSDAIAMALRFKAGIFVTKNVFEQCAIMIRHIDEPILSQSSNFQELQQEKSSSVLENINSQIEDYKKSLQEAIRSERFEEAARLRDKIADLITQFEKQ